MSGEIGDIIAYIREREESRPIREEVHRKYLELYEKMFINQELDKTADLIAFKDTELTRMEDYSKRKVRYRQKRSEIQEIE